MMEKHSLTPEEWLVTRLLFLAGPEEGHPEFVARYMGLPATRGFRETLLSLQEKGVLLKSWRVPGKGEAFKPEDVQMSKLFKGDVFRFSSELGGDLFVHYPVSMVIDGVTHMLRTPGRRFNCLEDMFFAYGKAIRHSLDAHRHVIGLLEWGRENGLVNMGMAEFIAGKAWLNLEDMRNGDGIADNVKSL